ncbi:MAG: thioredoxin family protein [Burkholderiales bacterium]|nr:thioredoxin family protein [Burkholderiales bacterium]
MAIPVLAVACSKAPDPVAVTKLAPAAAAHTGIAWVKPDGASLDAVFAQAKADNKPVFLYWGAVWCPPCNQIKATVFNRPDFVERSKAFIPVYLDGDTPGAQKLGTQFKVRGYPTTILFKPDGTELTRLPGEVDAVQYMQVLQLGLNAAQPIQQTLNAALGDAAQGSGALSADGWRLLAYYAWDIDEAQLLPKKDLAATVAQLARKCPPQQQEAAARLTLRAAALAAQEKTPTIDKAQALAAVQAILADAPRARESGDILINYANELVAVLTATGSTERAALQTALNAALDRLAEDATLSTADQLGAVQAKVGLALLDKPKSAKPDLPPELVAQAQAAADKADKAARDKYERQAVIPSAAHLLSDVGLIDASDAMLKAELPKAVSAYYHMLVLASNAKQRGDKVASLDWAEKAYAGSVGPATRLQWGSGYVQKLIELAPQDGARIEKAAGQVIGELDAAPETFYERNRRSLEKMGAQLNAWNAAGKHAAVVQKLNTQLNAVCAKLPEGDSDSGRAACQGVFTKPGTKKA